MRENYYCRVDIATKYGLSAAVLLHEFVRLYFENKAENRNFCGNRYWICVSRNELARMYPLWSDSKIKRGISKLRKAGLLLAGKYSVDLMDRTNWYSPSDEVLALYENYCWENEV